LQELELEKVITQLKNNQLSYNQFYNVDIEIPEYYAIQHYRKFKNDNLNINQKLSMVFLDIEVFSNHTGDFLPSNAVSPISAITIYNSKNQTYYSYFLILPQIKHLVDINLDTSELIKIFKNDLIKNKYIPEHENFELSFFTNELELIESCWSKIHEIDPVCLSGYYSDGYDIPYIYNRLKLLYNDDYKIAETLSKLKSIKIRKFGERLIIQISDYPILDIKHLYCPRNDGGLNYGNTQPNYSLDFISDQELQLKKLDYKSDGNSNLDTFYLNDPINYFKYNIIDVILTVRLNDKLDHINFHNILRRDMKCPLTQSIRGTSALFSSMFSYEIQEANQYFRYGIHKEVEHNIDQIEIEQIDLPKTKLIKKWTVKSINNQIFRKILSKYPGAYVAQGYDKIITSKDDKSIIVDADASLPPWEKIFIKRNNKIYWNNIKNYNFVHGDLTLTWDKNNNTCWKNVKGKTEHPWDGELITITTETGKECTITSNHSIFGIQQGVKSDESYLIDAGKLKLGDYVVGFKQFDPELSTTLYNPKTVGFWLSDGWTQEKNGTYYIAKQDKELLEIFKPSINKIRVKRKASGKYKKEWLGKITEPTRTDLKKFYITTKRKNFFEILNYNTETRKLIWDGMFFADGILHGLGRHDIKTPTERLCKYRYDECLECFLVAHTIGWKPRLTPQGINNKIKYGPNQIIPEVFRSHYGYSTHLKKLNLSSNNRHPFNKLINDFPFITKTYSKTIGLEKIVKITHQKYKGLVYDISVDETERFFAGTGIGAHNTALYPNTMKMYNISFDSLFGYIINSKSYNFLGYLDTVLGKNQKINATIKNDIFSKINIKINHMAPQNKNDNKQYYFFMFYHLLNGLHEANVLLSTIMNPQNIYHYILLKSYLMPLMHLFSEIVTLDEYHPDMYTYIVNNKELDYDLFIIQNINNTNINVIKLPGSQLAAYLKKNNVNINLSGSLFYTHKKHTGLLNKFITDKLEFRKQYKNKRDTFNVGSDDYVFYDNRQKSAKVNANSSYGLSGLSSFIYSNRLCAASTTLSGRLTLKLAQIASEYHIETLN